MIGLKLGWQLARTLETKPPLDLLPLLERLDLEVTRWRFQGRLREVIGDGVIGIDDRLPDPWVRWLTAHAIGHHLLHTGTWLYLAAWQWVNRFKAERQAEEFAAGLLVPPKPPWPALGSITMAHRLGIPECKAAWAERTWDAQRNHLA